MKQFHHIVQIERSHRVCHEAVQSVPSWKNNCLDRNKVADFHMYKQTGAAFLLNVLMSFRFNQCLQSSEQLIRDRSGIDSLHKMGNS